MVVKTNSLGMVPGKMIFNGATVEALKAAKSSEELDELQKKDPHRCLMARVLDQAVWDLETARINFYNGTYNSAMLKEYIYDTTNWFYRRNIGTVSFGFVCDALDVDPDTILRVLKERGAIPDTSSWAVDEEGNFIPNSGVLSWGERFSPISRLDVKFQESNAEDPGHVEVDGLHITSSRKVDTRGHGKKRPVRFR